MVLRGSFGESTLQMDLILRADTPWGLQLTSIGIRPMNCCGWSARWRPQPRWAADTSGGVLERPAAATTPVNKRDGGAGDFLDGQ